MQRSGGVAAIVCDITENTVREGLWCDGCLVIAGGYFGRVAEMFRLRACPRVQLHYTHTLYCLQNFFGFRSQFQKNPHAHKNKIGASTPASKNPRPLPLKQGTIWTWGFPAEEPKKCQAPKKLVQPLPAPELRGEKNKDMRLCLTIALTLFKSLWNYFPGCKGISDEGGAKDFSESIAGV